MAVTDPKNLVLLSMVGSAGIVVASDVQDSGSINGTHLLALGIVSVGITAAADTVPKVAVPLALLIFAGLLLSRGAKIFNNLSNKLASKGNTTAPGTNANASVGNASGVVVPPRQRVRTTAPGQRHR